MNRIDRIYIDSKLPHFYENLIEDFTARGEFVDIMTACNSVLDDHVLTDFKGVIVYRSAVEDHVYEITSHGNFSRTGVENKTINSQFQKWPPMQRWDPMTIDPESRVVGFGYRHRAFLHAYYGIDIDALSPTGIVNKFFSERGKNPDIISDSNKRQLLKNTTSASKIHSALKSNPEIYQRLVDFKDLVIDGFIVDESSTLTPVLLKEVLKNHVKANLGKYFWRADFDNS